MSTSSPAMAEKAARRLSDAVPGPRAPPTETGSPPVSLLGALADRQRACSYGSRPHE
jgi:hypothetical protein